MGGRAPSYPGPNAPDPGSPAPGTLGPGAAGVPGGAATPGAGQPRGPSAPSASLPDMPMPWTWGDTSDVRDAADWRLWWEFNKDSYLNRRAQIHRWSFSPATDAGFGDQTAVQAAVRSAAVPALLEAIRKGGSDRLVTAMMLTLAKIGDTDRQHGSSTFQPLISWFLKNGTEHTYGSAAVALGVMGQDAAVQDLVHILLDDLEGRQLVGRPRVDDRTRSMAAYALGLMGHRAKDTAVREEIVAALYDVLTNPNVRDRDVKVAAVVGMGQIPIERWTSQPDCDCGGVHHEVQTSREAQIAHLLWIFESRETCDPLVRAHGATTLGKLVAAGDVPAKYKERVVDGLMRALDDPRRTRQEVTQSIVLALGQIGDADADAVDARIRVALMRAAVRLDEQSRRFALISLAQVAARPGTGEDPLAGTPDARSFLLKQLARAKKQVKPWAGLALGVLGRELQDAGHERSPSVDRALESSLARAKGDEAAAYAIACGIRRNAEAVEAALVKLEKEKDASARGYVALSLGMMGAESARDPLLALVREDEHQSELHTQAAIGLGLLADGATVNELTARLAQDGCDDSARVSIAAALGFMGDPRSVRSLAALLTDADADETARTMAAVGLGIVADPDPRSWNAKLVANLNYRAATPSLTDEEGGGVLDVR